MNADFLVPSLFSQIWENEDSGKKFFSRTWRDKSRHKYFQYLNGLRQLGLFDSACARKMRLQFIEHAGLFRAVEAMEQAYGENNIKTTLVASGKRKDGGPSRIRTGDYRDVNAVS